MIARLFQPAEAFWILSSAVVGAIVILLLEQPFWLVAMIVGLGHVARVTGTWEDVPDSPPSTPAPEASMAQSPYQSSSCTRAQVPFMITARMTRDLRKLGYSDEEIDRMTPDTAWGLLKAADELGPDVEPDTGEEV